MNGLSATGSTLPSLTLNRHRLNPISISGSKDTRPRAAPLPTRSTSLSPTAAPPPGPIPASAVALPSRQVSPAWGYVMRRAWCLIFGAANSGWRSPQIWPWSPLRWN